MRPVGAEMLRVRLDGQDLDRPLDDAVEHVLEGFAGLALHPDVPAGLNALADLGIRLVTLSNGSARTSGPPIGGPPEGPCRSWTAPERCAGLLNESRLMHGCERDELVAY